MSTPEMKITPYRKAWLEFEASEEFQKSADPTTLGIPANQRQYFENRLRRAFEAGWNAKTSLILEALESQARGFGK